MTSDVLTHNPAPSTEIQISKDNRVLGLITEVGPYWNLEVKETGWTVFCASPEDALHKFFEHADGGEQQ